MRAIHVAAGGILFALGALFGRQGAGRRRAVEGPARRGQVVVPPDKLLSMQADGSLARLLLLGRIVNSLRFAHTAPLEVHDEGTPRADRQLMGAFLLQTAYALEAIDALKGMGPPMRDSPAWRAHVVPLFRDPEVQALDRQSIRDLRNQVVFHFDLQAIQKGLSQLADTQGVLLATSGRMRQDVYFPLADEAVIAYAVSGVGSSREQWMNDVRVWLGRATDLSLRIAEAVESVVVEIATENGLQGRW